MSKPISEVKILLTKKKEIQNPRRGAREENVPSLSRRKFRLGKKRLRQIAASKPDVFSTSGGENFALPP